MSNLRKITYTNDMTLVTLGALPGNIQAVSDVLTAIAAEGLNVDMISQTAPKGGVIRLSLTMSDDALAGVLSVLGRIRAKHDNVTPEILPGHCKIDFHDDSMENTPGVAAQAFAALSKADVEVMLITTSDVDISILVGTHDLDNALNALSETFGLEPEEEIH